MNGLAVLQRHDARHTASQLRHCSPMTYPAVRLDLAPERVPHNSRAPLALNVWPLPQDLLFEVTGGLHDGDDYRRDALAKAKRFVVRSVARLGRVAPAAVGFVTAAEAQGGRVPPVPAPRATESCSDPH
jgi:hypothetical protein